MKAYKWGVYTRLLTHHIEPIDERIPVDLRHAVFKDSQVAYGSLQVEDLQGLLTIVEAPGRPMSADLRLSPSTKKKR
jgi:hypothetical protein